MTDAIHGELVLRRCSGDADRMVDIHIGWLSAPKGAFKANSHQDKVLTAIRFNRDPGKVTLIDDDIRMDDLLGEADLASSLTDIRFPGSTADDDFMSGGALIVRATNETDNRGFPVYLAALVMQEAGDEADPALIYELRGEGGSIEILPSGRTMPMSPNGMALAQVHRSPIWSIRGDELSGPVSTMRLDVLNECQRLEDMIENGTDKKLDEYKRAAAGAAGFIVDNVSRDPQYEEFRKKMIEAGFKNRWTEFETASEEARRSKKADEIVRSLLSDKSA